MIRLTSNPVGRKRLRSALRLMIINLRASCSAQMLVFYLLSCTAVLLFGLWVGGLYANDVKFRHDKQDIHSQTQDDSKQSLNQSQHVFDSNNHESDTDLNPFNFSRDYVELDRSRHIATATKVLRSGRKKSYHVIHMHDLNQTLGLADENSTGDETNSSHSSLVVSPAQHLESDILSSLTEKGDHLSLLERLDGISKYSCQSFETGVKLKNFIFSGIVSRFDSFKIRNVIRSTWASQDNIRKEVLKLLPDAKNFDQIIRFCFFVSIPSKLLQDSQLAINIIQESHHYKDIIFLTRVRESYMNLTVATLEMFSHVYQNFDTDFFIKLDTDVFVNVSGLIQYVDYLSTIRKSPHVFAGKIAEYGNNFPLREDLINSKAEWQFDPAEYNQSIWPPYAFGFAYIVSKSLLPYLVDCRIENPDMIHTNYVNCRTSDRCFFKPLKFEDVTVGGIIYHALVNKKELYLPNTVMAIKSIREMYSPYYYNNNLFVSEPWWGKCLSAFIVIHRIGVVKSLAYYKASGTLNEFDICLPISRIDELLKLKINDMIDSL